MIAPIRILNSKSLPKDVWHPSVVYIPQGWNGHRWWMSETPYSPRHISPYTDRWELPCIHFSDDGLSWKPIAHNPIDNLSDEDIEHRNYLSDPHLVMKDGVLFCYYRHTLLENRQIQGNKTLLYRKSSVDGQHWSDREVIADLRKKEDMIIWGEQIISPSVLWNESKQVWECWYVDGSGYKSNRGVRYVTSTDGIHWEKYMQCVISMDNNHPWHVDVQIYSGIYHMLCYTDNNTLLLYTSNDGIDFAFKKEIMTSQPNTFFEKKIYRSCSVLYGNKYRIYFSGYDGYCGYIGLLVTKDWNNYKLNSVWWNTDYHCDVIKRKMKSHKRTFKQAIKRMLGYA